MRDFLQIGLMCYAVTLGLMAYLSVTVKRYYGWIPFTFYCGAFTIEGIVLFTVLASYGNGGMYVPLYWATSYIQDVLQAWVIVDVLWRWRKRDRKDTAILTGMLVSIVFPLILKYRAFVPVWTRDIPTYAMLAAITIWVHGLLLRQKEEA